MLRIPGVYRPQADTRLLEEALAGAGIPHGSRVLDVCTGSGALAVAAARAGAAEVIAVDRCRRAVYSARLNGLLRRLPLRGRHGDLLGLDGFGRFDLVLANPPYVPADPRVHHGRGRAMAWDAGPDGRRLLDPLCTGIACLLTRRGTLLMVHSALNDTEKSLSLLRSTGLKAAVVARSTIPFGPVLSGRTRYLTEAGLIEPGQNHEELVVIRADVPENPAH